MPQRTFKPGDQTSFRSDSLTHPHSAFFEDDGETGYFYALDLTRSDEMIVDAVHIYNVANVSDRERESSISILWSANGMSCALLINDYPTRHLISLQSAAIVAPTSRTSRTLHRAAGIAPIITGQTKRFRG